MGRAVAAAVGVTTLASASVPEEAAAFGPIKMELADPEYGSVVCPPKTQVRARYSVSECVKWDMYDVIVHTTSHDLPNNTDDYDSVLCPPRYR